MQTLAARLRMARQRQGLTLEKTASAAGISPRTLWRYEQGVLPDSRRSPQILQRLGLALCQDKAAFLSDYHRWLLSTAAQDVDWLLIHHRYGSVDALAKACGTTHRSLYQWREGRGQPTFQTWQVIQAQRKAPSV